MVLLRGWRMWGTDGSTRLWSCEELLEGSEIQIAAMPNTGYRFKMWNDQNTDNPRTIVVEGDANYIASFEKTTDGIDNFDADENNIRKVMIDGVIYIQKGDKLYNLLGAEVR